jgi:hypothetical protein
VDNRSKEHQWLNEQTIEANRQQIYRDDAQQELAEWIRFSSKEAKANQDGLTTASMEMNGIVGWVVRNFFTKEKVMEKGFREQGLDNVRKQVEKSGGWMIISSGDESVSGLLEAGMRYQRIGLKVRDHQIAIHPMSQILEEGPYKQKASNALGITGPVQFLIRMGYVTKYPLPVSLRRPIEQIIKL